MVTTIQNYTDSIAILGSDNAELEQTRRFDIVNGWDHSFQQLTLTSLGFYDIK